MRSFKFRVWDKETKRMHRLGDLLRDSLIFSDDGTTLYYNSLFCSQTSSYELMGWTGLQDQNGNDIYEGDIVDHKNVAGGIDRGIVSFHKGVYQVIHHFDQTEWGDPLWDCIVFGLEIMGNLYENQELLEKTSRE